MRRLLGVLSVSFVMALWSCPSVNAGIDKTNLQERIRGLSIPFIENQGQTDGRVAFFAHAFGGTIFLTKDGKIVYSLPGLREKSRACQGAHGWVISESFSGANMPTTLKGDDRARVRINYFRGRDPRMWQKGATAYNIVRFGEIYRGVNLVLRAHGNNVEKIFEIDPWADPGSIRLRVEGAKGLRVSEDGRLILETGLGPVSFTRPVAYQQKEGQRHYVKISYVVRGDEYGFDVKEYDRTRALFIDPLLASTFLGGSEGEGSGTGENGWDEAFDILVDPTSGSVYVTGETQSLDFPTTTGAYDNSPDGWDAFVSKLSPDLSTLLASTLIGGSSGETAKAIAMDGSGDIYITGATSSLDFPTTTGAYDDNETGTDHIFICKLSPDLSTLLASTLLGGYGADSYADALAIGPSGDVYVAGEADGYTPDSDEGDEIRFVSNFPVTRGAYDTTYNGDYSDGFVSKLDANLTQLEASTFLGGNDTEWINTIAIDASGNVYVAGSTYSSNFPTTSNAYDTNLNEDPYESDGFVSKFSPDLSILMASTFLGGSSSDSVNTIAIDASGNICAAGGTNSHDFPTTSGTYQPQFFENDFSIESNGFITRLSPDLSGIMTSTFLVKDGVDTVINDIAIGNEGSIYVAGDPLEQGIGQAFVARINQDFSRLMGMIQFGGSDDDSASAIAIGPLGNVYATGYTYSEDFPVTPDSYDPTFNGLCDAFISVFDSELSSYQFIIDPEPVNGVILGGREWGELEDILCGEGISESEKSCQHPYGEIIQITLYASPDDGYYLKGWTGDCAGCDGEECIITVDADKTCSAVFSPIDITEDIEQGRSRILYDRLNHCFFVYITLANISEGPITGPVGMILESSTIPLNDASSPGLDPDGYTDDGKPYFIIVPEGKSWGAGEQLDRIRLDFKLMRKRLNFDLRFESRPGYALQMQLPEKKTLSK